MKTLGLTGAPLRWLRGPSDAREMRVLAEILQWSFLVRISGLLPGCLRAELG